MTLYAVSDLHIRDEHDPLYFMLLALLGERAVSGDQVVLAGDIFDVFVGDKPEFTERYADFMRVVGAAAARGVAVDYIEGNHDFLLERALGRHGVRVHTRRLELQLGGKRLFIAHGDLANPADIGYRLLRFFFRSPVFHIFVYFAPRGWLSAVGRWSSRYSRGDLEGVRSNASHMPRERLESLRQVYRNFAAERACEGFDFIVLGHCHDLDEKVFAVGEREVQYINVGYPRAHGSLVSWSEGDTRFQRESFVN